MSSSHPAAPSIQAGRLASAARISRRLLASLLVCRDLPRELDYGEAHCAASLPTEASVCPLLAKTPPSTARNGTIWPGRLKSDGLDVLSASLRDVLALS